jgi:hypothetical protein
MWYFVFLNVGTQYICIRGVYDIIAQTDPLTVNVVLTLRKAVSVVLSITLFGHAFSSWHWIGAFLVFAAGFYFGTLPAPAPAGGGVGLSQFPVPLGPVHKKQEAEPGGDDVQQDTTTPMAVVVAHDVMDMALCGRMLTLSDQHGRGRGGGEGRWVLRGGEGRWVLRQFS